MDASELAVEPTISTSFATNLQRIEPVSHSEPFAFEIGRVGRSCLEEDPLELGMHLSKRDYGVFESGAILIG